jgi:hypothetical protein
MVDSDRLTSIDSDLPGLVEDRFHFTDPVRIGAAPPKSVSENSVSAFMLASSVDVGLGRLLFQNGRTGIPRA